MSLPRIPLLILSSNRAVSRELRDACRRTWLAELGPGYEWFFVLGDPYLREAWVFDGDLLTVRSQDDYQNLVEKTRLALCALHGRSGFPWLFKCDDDTCLNPWEFQRYPFADWDQVGARIGPIAAPDAPAREQFGGWCSGGGYSLSRRAVEWVIQRMPFGIEGLAEDRNVGQWLREMPGVKIKLESHFHVCSRENWQPGLLGHWLKTREAMEGYHAKHAEAEGQPWPRAEEPRPATDEIRRLERAEWVRAGALEDADEGPGPAVTARPARKPAKKSSRIGSGNGRILVQIAAYRESDLVPTLENLFAQAADPGRLRVALCWQRSEEESLQQFAEDERMRIVDVPWQESRGLGWARRITQHLHEGEEFVMQIDAHERFVNGWDAQLCEMLPELDSPKPVLTTYPEAFTPGQLLPDRTSLRKLIPTSFYEHGDARIGAVKFGHAEEEAAAPLRGRLMAGGFFFTVGQHCQEVPQDPLIYFSDEVVTSVRSWTHGYDIFYPHRHLAWHHYARTESFRHWKDHSVEAAEAGEVEQQAGYRQQASQARQQQLFGLRRLGLRLGEYGLGRERSLADYELFAGMKFSHRCIHPDALNGLPPGQIDDPEWFLGERPQLVVKAVPGSGGEQPAGAAWEETELPGVELAQIGPEEGAS